MKNLWDTFKWLIIVFAIYGFSIYLVVNGIGGW